MVAVVVVGCGGPGMPAGEIDAPAAIRDAAPDAPPAACGSDGDCAGAHAVCDDALTPHACGCACGYAPDGAGGCAWAGVVADPGLAQAGTWTGATFDPGDLQAGLIDPGSAHVALEDRLTQSFCMPRRDRAEPLVASVAYRNTDINVYPSFGIGPAWHYEFNGGQDWLMARACLGEAEYAAATSTGRGASRTITFMGSPPWGVDPFTPKGFDVDHVEIIPAAPGECPAPGTALNGDGEAAGGWVPQVRGTGSFGLDPGIGTNGSHGIHFHVAPATGGGGGDVVATTHLAIPLSGSPALAFFRQTSLEYLGYVTISIDGWPLPDLGDTAAGVERLCIPAFMRGSVRRLTIRLLASSTSQASDAVFDDVALVDDPACGTDPVLTDPGFDAPYPLIGASDGTLANHVHTVQDAARAHTGAGVLVLEQAGTCDSRSFSDYEVAVPMPPTGSAGNALAFYYKAAANPDFALTVRGASLGTLPTIVQDGTWHRGFSCLLPLPTGHDEGTLFFIANRNGGTCRAPLTAYVDDLVLTTDPSCPTM